MKTISKCLFLGSISVFLFFQTALYAQHLYRSDGSKIPLYVSPHHVSVQLRPELSVEQRTTYLSTLTEIDGKKNKRGLSNGYLVLPVKEGTNVNNLMRSLRSSGMFLNVDPEHMALVISGDVAKIKEGIELLGEGKVTVVGEDMMPE